MAITAAAGFAGTNTKTWNVTATADADTGDFAVAHGFGVAPALAFLTPLLNAGLLANWSVKSIDATNITLNKGATAVGSGNAGASVRLTVMLPHSLIG